MAQVSPPAAEMRGSSAQETSTHLTEPSLNLLLEWPSETRTRRWQVSAAISLGLHLVGFLILVVLPSFVSTQEPEPKVVVKKTPLYFPLDVLTQKAPNRNKLSKEFDLADLLPPQPQARPKTASRPRRAVQLPAKRPNLKPSSQPPQIIAEAPKLTPDTPSQTLPQGSLNSPLAPVEPPPTPTKSPFENVGASPETSTKAKLAPPRATVQQALRDLSHESSNSRVVVSDQGPSSPANPIPGLEPNRPKLSGSVELQSDPQGADVRPYLAQILSIVRRNWFTVMPESARLGMLRGRTVILFAISRNGTIEKVVIGDRSGSQPLDTAAISSLSMSNPLPPLPSDYRGIQMKLAFSFNYNIPGLQ